MVRVLWWITSFHWIGAESVRLVSPLHGCANGGRP